MSDYCEKCGEKIRSKIQMKGDAEQTKCGLCMDDELNANKCHCDKCGIEMLSTRNPLPELCSSCERDKSKSINQLPWIERLPMISTNPDLATRDDVARMAAELILCRKCNFNLREKIAESVSILLTVK